MDEINEVLSKTICTRCQYFCERQITPIEWDNDEEAFLEISCVLLEIDLGDHICKSCRYFTEEEEDTRDLFGGKFLDK